MIFTTDTKLVDSGCEFWLKKYTCIYILGMKQRERESGGKDQERKLEQ